MPDNPNRYPGIPMPNRDIASLYNTIMALKETVELLTGARTASSRAIIWNDLVQFGIIKDEDVPR